MREETLHLSRSPYQKIHFVRLPDYDRVALYLDNATQFVSGIDEESYHYALASLPARMMQGERGDVLILGGGDGLAARDLLRFPNVGKVTMVELDPEVVRLCSDHPEIRKLNEDSFQSPRLEVIVDDARNFLSSRPRSLYRLCIVDFPDPLTPDLAQLFSPALYRSILPHLSGLDYVLSVQSSGAWSDVEDHVKKTLEEVTGRRTRSTYAMGQFMSENAIVHAGPGLVPFRNPYPPHLARWMDLRRSRWKDILGYEFP